MCFNIEPTIPVYVSKNKGRTWSKVDLETKGFLLIYEGGHSQLTRNDLVLFQNKVFNLNNPDHLIVLLLDYISPLKDQIRKLTKLDTSRPFVQSESENSNKFKRKKPYLISEELIEKIRDVLHDKRGTWVVKAAYAHQLIHDRSFEALRNQSHSKDRQKTYGIRNDVYDYSQSPVPKTLHCECCSHEAKEGDMETLNITLRFILETSTLTWHAKGILAYMLFHKYRVVSYQEINEGARNLYSYTTKGLNELLELAYIEEVDPDILQISSKTYTEGKESHEVRLEFIKEIEELEELRRR